VTIADIPVDAEGGQIEPDLARPMRAVDEHRRAGGMTRRRHSLDRQDQRARRGDVVEDGKLGARAQRIGDACHDGVGARVWERQRRLDHARPAALGDIVDGIAHGAVDMAEHQDLVAGLETQRAQHGVAADRGILDEGDVLALGADEFGEPRRRMAQRVGQHAAHEARGLLLEAMPPRILRRADDQRRRTERAMIDGEEPPIERPFVANRRAERRQVQSCLAHRGILAYSGRV